MRILVTGGAGFIGSHVVEAHLADGHEVHILDDLSSGRRENIPAAAILHQADIRSVEARSLLLEGGFDVLVHHAAQMDVRRSVADPSFDADVNVRGFLNLMEAGREAGLGRVVFASTGGALYGEPLDGPQSEDTPTSPVSPYGITKLCTEKYLHYYHVQYGIPYVALRYGNVYGPRQNPHGDAGVVAIFAGLLLEGRRPRIFGDGEQTRDYVYVGDVVEANRRAIQHSDATGPFNVGTGIETTVNRLFEVLADAAGYDREPEYAPRRTGEQQRSVLDANAMNNAFGWRPQVRVEEGLPATLAYFRDRIQAEAG